MPASTRPSENRPSHYIAQILAKVNSPTASDDIHVSWLPGHVGIPSKERADRAAKIARKTDMQPCLTPPSDFKPNIHKYITTMWPNTWDERPLHEITPIVNQPRTHHLNNHRDQSVFTRSRIGHSCLTPKFLLKGEPPPECIPYTCPHLDRMECADLNYVRRRFYQVPSYTALNLSLTHSLTHSLAKRWPWYVQPCLCDCIYKIQCHLSKRVGHRAP